MRDSELAVAAAADLAVMAAAAAAAPPPLPPSTSPPAPSVPVTVPSALGAAVRWCGGLAVHACAWGRVGVADLLPLALLALLARPSFDLDTVLHTRHILAASCHCASSWPAVGGGA